MSYPPLKPGQYHIFSSVRDRPVGRSMLEDISPFPKRVQVLPRTGEILERTVFEFRPTPRPHEFHVKCGGADVGVVDGKLVAFVIVPGQSVAFTVNSQFHLGGDVYTIERPEERTGWVAREEDDTQIEVRPLISEPGDPPFFPPFELFRIVPVN